MILLSAVANASDSLYVDYIQRSDTFFQAGRFDSSLIMAQKALDEAFKQYGEEDTLVARALYRMGGCKFNMNHKAEAESLWTVSLAIREKLRGANHAEVAECLKGHAIIAYDKKQYDVAESFLNRAAQILENLPEKNRLELARVINEVANIRLMTGNYPGAEELYIRALQETEMAGEVKNESYMKILNNLGLVLMWQGKYRQAQEYLLKAISMTEETFGPLKPELHSMLSNLSITYMRYNEYEQAIECCQRAIAIVEELYGTDSRELAVKLHTMCIAYSHMGRLKEAEQAALRCIAIRKQYYPDDKLIIASPYTTLARIYYDLGDSTAFREAYNQALTTYLEAIDSQTYTADLPRQLQSFSWHFRDYDSSLCLRFAKLAFELRRDYLVRNCRSMSERSALKYAQFMRLAAANYLSNFMDMESPDGSLKIDAADVIFASKGQVSDEIFERNLSLIEEADSVVAAHRDQLSRIKMRLSGLYASGKLDDSGAADRNLVDSLLTEKYNLDAELIKHTSGDSRSREAQLITAERVASNLPEGTGLVEYLRYQLSMRNPDQDVIHYLVLILKPGDTTPMIRDLGPAERLDSLISQYRSHMQAAADRQKSPNELDQEYRQLAFLLYSIIWQPIENQISGCQPVFIAPDGALNLLSFAGLLDGEGRYLAEVMPIQYLSSGRDIIWLNQGYQLGRGMLALGDPDYDAPASERLAGTNEYHAVDAVALQSSLGTYPEVYRNIRSECQDLRDFRVTRLQATRDEVEQTIEFWRQSYSDSAIGLLGKYASEDNFKRLAPGNRVIHIATHGFYDPPDCREKEIVINPDNAIGNSYGSYEPSPLLQSGLFLAGSNLHGEMADSLRVDDGILTAEEVSTMDLTGVERVVLSACESGLGEVEAGEGVYGLRRAFQMAGARTVISSLWPVADRSTAEFMISLYKASDQPLYKKIHEYQKAQIEKLRKHGYSDHPYQWAAFIATGDWR